MTEIDEEKIKRRLLACEDYIVSEDIDSFITCAKQLTGIEWVKKDLTFFTEDGELIRVIGLHRLNDEVLSIIAYYDIEMGFEYAGFEIDISSLEDVRRVIQDI
ncbi:MAG: hypothetical protein ABWJ42_02905 [Sulfolobales archaeon]